MNRGERSIRSVDDLAALENLIADEVRKFPLDGLLLGLRAVPRLSPRTGEGIPPHVVGVAVRFAVKFGKPGAMGPEAIPIRLEGLRPLLRFAGEYAHADPVGWNADIPCSPLSICLRHVGNQFPYNLSPAGKFARAEILYNELPGKIRGRKGVPDFDFHAKFCESVGVSVSDFIDVGHLVYAAAGSTSLGFARGYFEAARRQKLAVPRDEIVRLALDHFAADSVKHASLCEQYQQKDRRFACYDFNSLFVHPLIRPWPLNSGEDMNLDRMVAPLPDLIPYRVTSGIYYQMRESWSEGFDKFFGHLLAEYVGHLLRGMVAEEHL